MYAAYLNKRRRNQGLNKTSSSFVNDSDLGKKIDEDDITREFDRYEREYINKNFGDMLQKAFKTVIALLTLDSRRSKK